MSSLRNVFPPNQNLLFFFCVITQILCAVQVWRRVNFITQASLSHWDTCAYFLVFISKICHTCQYYCVLWFCASGTHQLKHHGHTLPCGGTNVFPSIHQTLVALQRTWMYTVYVKIHFLSETLLSMTLKLLKIPEWFAISCHWTGTCVCETFTSWTK